MYRHILVPLDGSELAEQVLPHVTALAAPENDVQVTLLQAVMLVHAPSMEFGTLYGDRPSPVEETTGQEEQARSYLQKVAAQLHEQGYTVDVATSRAPAADAICTFAEQHNVDLIAIATHGRSGLNRWLHGSVTQKVIQAAPAPMLIIHPA